MDAFGYQNARIAGNNAGAGIYSSARWATERVDGFPPPASPLSTRYQLRYVQQRIGTPVDVRSLAAVLDEVDGTMNGEDVATPKFVCPATRKRARKQEKPQKR